MFSIIIPLYNKADYLVKTINSVLDQTFRDFELIIINDGSTDSSLSVVEQFSDKRIKVYNQLNSGVSVARNNGVKYAKFEYIAFLDADDWWDSHFLEEMYKLIMGYQEAGLYGCSYNRVKNTILYPANIGTDKNFVEGYIDYFQVYARTFWSPINCSFVVVKKTIFEEVGGFLDDLKFGEDFHLWAKIALKYKVAYLNKEMAFSNQDVNHNHRALGNNKYYHTSTHFIFNLSFLENEVANNKPLKKLLDGLRVRSLIRYHLNGKYKNEVAIEIGKVNFTEQSNYYNFIYKYPKSVVNIFFMLKKIGSLTKQRLIRIVLK